MLQSTRRFFLTLMSLAYPPFPRAAVHFSLRMPLVPAEYLRTRAFPFIVCGIRGVPSPPNISPHKRAYPDARTPSHIYVHVQGCPHNDRGYDRPCSHSFTFRASSLTSFQATLSTYTAVGIFEGGFRVSDNTGHLALRHIQS